MLGSRQPLPRLIVETDGRSGSWPSRSRASRGLLIGGKWLDMSAAYRRQDERLPHPRYHHVSDPPHPPTGHRREELAGTGAVIPPLDADDLFAGGVVEPACPRLRSRARNLTPAAGDGPRRVLARVRQARWLAAGRSAETSAFGPGGPPPRHHSKHKRAGAARPRTATPVSRYGMSARTNGSGLTATSQTANRRRPNRRAVVRHGHTRHPPLPGDPVRGRTRADSSAARAAHCIPQAGGCLRRPPSRRRLGRRLSDPPR
jgi:hypothetical protein